MNRKIDVQVGQLWIDLDKRMKGRACIVDEVKDGFAFMTPVNVNTYEKIGRKTRVAISRMYKHSTGWEFLG